MGLTMSGNNPASSKASRSVGLCKGPGVCAHCRHQGNPRSRSFPPEGLNQSKVSCPCAELPSLGPRHLPARRRLNTGSKCLPTSRAPQITVLPRVPDPLLHIM